MIYIKYYTSIEINLNEPSKRFSFSVKTICKKILLKRNEMSLEPQFCTKTLK